MNYIALDIGKKRTGVAYADDEIDVPLALETLVHDTEDDLLDCVLDLIKKRGVACVALGMPLLPSGKEGKQAQYVNSFAKLLKGNGIPVEFIDERYTTPREKGCDGDKAAACAILALFLERKK